MIINLRQLIFPSILAFLVSSSFLCPSCSKDDASYTAPPDTVSQSSHPAPGIHYSDDPGSVTLCLFAPGKQTVHVIGDFNNWTASDASLMTKDGNYFWTTITGLTPQKDYVFQYLIDNEICIGDPYCDQVSDPLDDEIPATTYPNLVNYPSQADGIASVIRTGQANYQWQSKTTSKPSTDQLVIYELLIRDFTAEGTYNAVIKKLSYLDSLGVNAIELMPFNEFEGNDSWGYNPNYYFAPDKAYGTKNDLKALIDSCHRRGLMVIQDIVLNHAYGSCPLVKMYWDNSTQEPSAASPWFNTSSPNTTYSYGYDFNHESPYTQDFVDSVTTYWLTQYHVDGYRFDFTKGFTNTVGDGYAYDASRIALLERIAGHIRTVKPDAYIILEHFTAISEQKELANDGLLLWENGNYNFNEATMGYVQNSDFSHCSWQYQGYSEAALVSYMESHDEERLMFKNKAYGNSDGDYQVTTTATGLERNQLAAVFFFSLTGPKMIWQFGEFGYDISIDDNGRTGKKPLEWNYLDDDNHRQLFHIYQKMIHLKEKYSIFQSGKETLQLTGTLKFIQLEKDNQSVMVIGNFGLTSQKMTFQLPHSGTWYNYFNQTETDFSQTSVSVTLKPGEYRLYSDWKLSI